MRTDLVWDRDEEDQGEDQIDWTGQLNVIVKLFKNKLEVFLRLGCFSCRLLPGKNLKPDMMSEEPT